ncbi:6590_t:CDS:1, partial [Scutellospora calospora]
QFGKMSLRVEECLDAEISVKLWNEQKNNDQTIIFHDKSIKGGLEVVGDVIKLLGCKE